MQRRVSIYSDFVPLRVVDKKKRTVSGYVMGRRKRTSIDLRMRETPWPLIIASARARPPSAVPSDIIHFIRACVRSPWVSAWVRQHNAPRAETYRLEEPDCVEMGWISACIACSRIQTTYYSGRY